MLNSSEDQEERADAGVASHHLFAGDDGEAGKGVQFVDRPVGFDARRILGDALAAGKTGFSFIAAFGIDAIESDTGIVKRFFVRHNTMFAQLVCGRKMKVTWLSPPLNRTVR